MPRVSRKKSRSGMYHIMLRGVNKQNIFEDDSDKVRLLETLKKYKDISNIKIYSYCLMDNHIHLLVKETEETISKAIQRISVSYVLWYNNKYERIGHLFQGRFRSETVETSASILKIIRYIHQNPVKAGLASSVCKCKWTSMHEYMNNADIVDTDFILSLLSPDKTIARKLFINYMVQPNEDQCLEDPVKIIRPDREVIKCLKRLGVPNINSLQQMPTEKRNAIIAELKFVKGVSVRQLSRITGISKSVIDRIR